MTVFAEYAKYYDLLYKDKPYKQEVAYITKVLKKHVPAAKSLIELGCGSGVHASYLAEAGFQVYGVDQSESMLEAAKERCAKLPQISLHKGDVRSVRLNVKVDAVLSLFHVVSYQTSDVDVRAMFATAGEHLQAGGIFFFDVWYGPAVLTDRPLLRVKELEDEEVHITRIATPTMDATKNTVDVHYRLIARNKKTGVYSETQEHHLMRYFFTPELSKFAADTGFEVIDSHEWITENSPSFNSWGVSFICQKK